MVTGGVFTAPIVGGVFTAGAIDKSLPGVASATFTGRCGRARLAPMNIDNQAVRIRQQKRRVVAHVAYIEHDARNVVGKLSRANPLEIAVVGHFHRSANQFRGELHAMKIKKDAVRIGHARRFVLHLGIQIDCHARINIRRPMTNAGDQRRLTNARFCRRPIALVSVAGSSADRRELPAA